MLAFVVTAPVADAEVAADVLWQLGVRGIEERAADGGDVVELWTSVGSESAAIERAVDAIAGRWAHRTVEIVDAGVELWRDHAQPMWVNEQLVVVPAWCEAPVGGASGDGPFVVTIEPGGAFGLGDHPTTLLSLRAMLRLVERRPARRCDLLDVGCGTGVIAITAALRSEGSIRAVDIAAAAVESTAANARLNGVEDRVTVDTTAAGAVEGDYDVVVANILAPTLVELAPDLRRLTRPQGRLVVSGILEHRHEHVIEALAPMIVERTDALDGWASVTLRHR